MVSFPLKGRDFCNVFCHSPLTRTKRLLFVKDHVNMFSLSLFDLLFIFILLPGDFIFQRDESKTYFLNPLSLFLQSIFYVKLWFSFNRSVDRYHGFREGTSKGKALNYRYSRFATLHYNNEKESNSGRRICSSNSKFFGSEIWIYVS